MDRTYLPGSLKTAVRTVANAALSDGQVENTDCDALKKAGFSDSAIKELLAQTDFFGQYAEYHRQHYRN